MRRCAAVLGMALAVAAQPEVTLPGLGKLAGSVKATPSQVDVEQYLGVRYTQAPLGELRLRPPTDPLPWEGTYDATQLKTNVCPGSYCEYVGAVDTEDCLFLNVYTPVDARLREAKLPVVVWIHGGGFGSGCAVEYPGEQLVGSSVNRGEPVVAVTINYRLGLLGFLGSNELRDNDTSASTGNYGMLDQRKALEWVNRYISNFGGDANRVTIAGESAGAASVNVHMVSEGSYKLFHRAIAQSGLGASFASKELSTAEDTYAKVKAALGCADAACMRAQPLERYVELRRTFGSSYFSPVVDGVELTQAPWKLLREGKFADVPVLTGANRDEYAYYLIYYSMIPNQATEANFDALLRPVLPAGAEGDVLLAELKQLYSNESYTYPPVSEWAGRNYWWMATMRAVGDRVFYCPNRWGAHAVARGAVNRWGHRSWLPWRRSPVYQYFLTRPTQTMTVQPGSGEGAFTAPHASDIPYFMNCSLVGDCTDYYPRDVCPKAVPDPNCAFANTEEQNLANRMSSTFVRFAAGEHPGFPFLRTSGHKSVDYSVGLDVSCDDGGKGFFPILNNRQAQCGFWDARDRPTDDTTAQAQNDVFLRQHLKL